MDKKYLDAATFQQMNVFRVHGVWSKLTPALYDRYVNQRLYTSEYSVVFKGTD